jgi:hypothetical protein
MGKNRADRSPEKNGIATGSGKGTTRAGTSNTRADNKATGDVAMFGFIVDAVTAPIKDTLDVLDGLTEGELRTHAALRLGTDVVAGMAVSEILEALEDNA